MKLEKDALSKEFSDFKMSKMKEVAELKTAERDLQAKMQTLGLEREKADTAQAAAAAIEGESKAKIQSLEAEVQSLRQQVQSKGSPMSARADPESTMQPPPPPPGATSSGAGADSPSNKQHVFGSATPSAAGVNVDGTKATATTSKDGAALTQEVAALKEQNVQLMAKIEDQQRAAAQEAVRAFRNVRLNAEKQFKWLFDMQSGGGGGVTSGAVAS